METCLKMTKCFMLMSTYERYSYWMFIWNYLQSQSQLIIMFLTWRIFVLVTINFIQSFILRLKKSESVAGGEPYLKHILSEKKNSSSNVNSIKNIFPHCTEEIKKYPKSLSLKSISTEYIKTDSLLNYSSSDDLCVTKLTNFLEIKNQNRQERNALQLIRSFSVPTTAVENSRLSISALLNKSFILEEPIARVVRKSLETTYEEKGDVEILSYKEETATRTQMRKIDHETPPPTRREVTSMETPVKKSKYTRKEVNVRETTQLNTFFEEAQTVESKYTNHLEISENLLKDVSTTSEDVKYQEVSKIKPKATVLPTIRRKVMYSNRNAFLNEEHNKAFICSPSHVPPGLQELPRKLKDSAVNCGEIIEQETFQNVLRSNVFDATVKAITKLDNSPRKEKVISTKSKVWFADLKSPQSSLKSASDMDSGDPDALTNRKNSGEPTSLTTKLRPRSSKSYKKLSYLKNELKRHQEINLQFREMLKQ